MNGSRKNIIYFKKSLELPKEYQHWKTVYTLFSRCKKKNVWENTYNKILEVANQSHINARSNGGDRVNCAWNKCF